MTSTTIWKAAAIAAAMAATFVAGLATASTQNTKKAYIVVQADVTNPVQYQSYASVSPGIITSFGGRFLARGGRTVTLEGTPAKSRVVVIEFPSFEKAQDFYKSPAYESARKLREGAATAQFVVVEGME